MSSEAYDAADDCDGCMNHGCECGGADGYAEWEAYREWLESRETTDPAAAPAVGESEIPF